MTDDPTFERKLRGIRERIDHPVIDSDGHCIEFLPAVREELRALAGDDALARFDQLIGAQRLGWSLSPAERRAVGLWRLGWWVFPARNTRDRATAMLPSLLHERLPELGIDFALVYPTYGLIGPAVDETELRLAICRAFNRYMAEAYRPYADRLTPAAVIPMHTPEEAIAELRHCVRELGMKVAVLAGSVWRPLPGGRRDTRWLDAFGLDSAHDYDPVWRECLALGVLPSFHTSAMGWPPRNSPTSYVFNHLGNFAQGNELTCRSLLLGGVFHRFPALRTSFLEGGIGWSAQLYADLVGHWEKRNAGALAALDPAHLDRAVMRALFDAHAPAGFRAHADALDASLETYCEPAEPRVGLDEFARSGIGSPEDLKRIFTQNLYFGCEADDPLNAWAFDARVNPLGARLNPLFGSDIGHWDVPDMREVLIEAWELVEHGLIDEAAFRDFTFANAARALQAMNPRFFEGTAISARSIPP